MFEKFSTQRLSVSRIHLSDFDGYCEVQALLCANVTQHLPDTWRKVDSLEKSKGWLEQRVAEGDVFSLQLHGRSQVIGLLFVYGLDRCSEQSEVRIGYLIAEAHWGKGLASELIGGLLSELAIVAGVVAVTAGVSGDNVGSSKVLIKNQFKLAETQNGTEFYQYLF